MSKQTQDPELDLLIIESLSFEFRSVNDISEEINVSADSISATLDELCEQGMAIEKKGLTYRLVPEENE